MEREIKSFDDIARERYCSLKESIESLMAIMNLDGLTKVERTRVLTALIQLINDNSEKPMNLRISDTRDTIYHGNVFSHYFSDEDKEKAVEILSNTNLLNELEKLIYTINFYMPNDKDFIRVYSESNKDVAKIAEYYGLKGEDATKFVRARIIEIFNFLNLYNDYKEKQTVSESQVFIALQEATDNPSVENIENARRLIMALQNEGLKEVLTRQLEMLGADALSNQEVSGGYWDIPEEPMANMDDTHVYGFSSEEEEINIPPHLETLAQGPTAYEEETLEPQLEVYVPESNEELEPVMKETVVEEPIPLQVIQGTKIVSDDNVADEVRESVQLFVVNSKKREQELKEALASTQDDLSRANDRIIYFEDAMNTSSKRINDLESENARKDELIAKQEAEITKKDEKIKGQREEIVGIKAELQESHAKNEELVSENRTIRLQLGSYKATILELGEMVKGAQDMGEHEETFRKVA